MKLLSLLLLLNVCGIFALNVTINHELEDSYVVTTTTGKVRGASGGTTVGLKKHIYSFKGIPFAEPPVGNLRFEPPVAKQPWQGTLDVSKPGPICIQGSNPVTGSEDCLYVKVYTTKAPHKNNKLPVMVWVYGGAFFGGAPDFSEHSPDYLLDEDVIVVSFHYRVGLFGFLSTGDAVAPGNYGLKDQLLALQWIKANIKNFGGDPDNITLFGQSAGAASIAYLLQTDKSAGLYNRVIMQSGNSLNQFSLSRQVPDFVKRVASNVNVKTTNSQVMVNGLRAVAAETLQAASASKYNTYLISNSNPLNGLPLGPVIEVDHEGAIVTGNSHEKLQNGQYQQVPILIGHTSSEALLDSIGSAIKLLLTVYDLQHSKLVPASMNLPYLTKAVVGGTIKKHYFGGKSLASSAEEVLNQYISDDQFERGIQEAANLYALRVPVYYYNFAYEGALYGKTDRPVPGVGHTEDLGYIFDFGYEGSAADYLTRHRVVRLWCNFAKTGNPTPKTDSLIKLSWPTNPGVGSVQQLLIDKELSIVTNPNNEHNTFWRNLFAKKGRPPFGTY